MSLNSVVGDPQSVPKELQDDDQVRERRDAVHSTKLRVQLFHFVRDLEKT
jgi:hypothetical protein